MTLKQTGETPQQVFFRNQDGIDRRLTTGGYEPRAVLSAEDDEIDIKQYVQDYLNASVSTARKSGGKKINYIDLFCGGGGMSLGVHNALREFGFDARLLLAADLDEAALRLVVEHFSPMVLRSQPVEDLIKFSVDLSGVANDFVTKPTILDSQIAQFKGKVDLLIGGPPCQGHSNLNNKTRRHDPRNLLYFTMPAFAIALDVPCVVIENVRSIKNASENVIPISRKIFEKNGYFVDEIILEGTDFGVAQTRSRHFLVATRNQKLELDIFVNQLKSDPLTFDDVNSQLPKIDCYPQLLETPTALSKENQKRISHLHETESFNLKNDLRPDCHQDGHTYPSVYGRLRGDAPSGTITTGFGSPGRGRFIHPHEPRMITIREAARLQSFPDWYFSSADKLELSKNNLYKIIGDAVPSLMVYPLMASLLDSFQKKFSDKKA